MEYLIVIILITLSIIAIYLYRELQKSRRTHKEVLKDIEESNKLFDRYKEFVF